MLTAQDDPHIMYGTEGAIPPIKLFQLSLTIFNSFICFFSKKPSHSTKLSLLNLNNHDSIKNCLHFAARSYVKIIIYSKYVIYNGYGNKF